MDHYCKSISDASGSVAPGSWSPCDDAEEYGICPECGAEPGEMCSFPSPENDGTGIEVGSFVHVERVRAEEVER